MTERYMLFKSEDANGLAELGISRVMVEVSPMGEVLREIGFDGSDNVVYRFPGPGRFGKRGLFDNATISARSLGDLTPKEFNEFFEEKN